MRLFLSASALALLVFCANGLLSSLSGEGAVLARVLYGTGAGAALVLLFVALHLSHVADDRELAGPDSH